jgi:hypothetical protein
LANIQKPARANQKGKSKGESGGGGGGGDSSEGESNKDSDDEEEDEDVGAYVAGDLSEGLAEDDDSVLPTLKIMDFRWCSPKRVKGYFVVRFGEEIEDRTVGVKELILDYPEETCRFVMYAYGRIKGVVDYFEKIAKSKHVQKGFPRRQVCQGFVTLNHYCNSRGWKRDERYGFMQSDAPCDQYAASKRKKPAGGKKRRPAKRVALKDPPVSYAEENGGGVYRKKQARMRWGMGWMLETECRK